MGIREWWGKIQTRRAGRYLAHNPQYALNALRYDNDLAANAVRRMFEMEAARNAPHRDSSAFPILGPFGLGSSQPLQQTLPKPTPANIRRFSEIAPARRAIAAIRDPILDFPFAIEPRRPIGKFAHDAVPDITDEMHQRIVGVTNMLHMPNNDLTWRQWVSKIIEDLLIFGAGVFEIKENESDERQMFLWPVDAQSIRINAGWEEGSKGHRYGQDRGYFMGTPGSIDIKKYSNDQICYMVLNPRTSTPFGLGYCEVAFGVINAFLGGFEYAERRASNNTPNFGIFLGENVTIDQARQWQHYWRNEIEGYGSIPIIAGGKAPSIFAMQGTGEDNLFLRWQEHCIRIIGMSFGVSPLKLALERDVNRSTAAASQESDWATVAPIANLIRDYLTHWLLWYRMGMTDLEFVWKTRTTDELKQAQILAEQWDADAIYVDEIREIYERPPLPDGLGQMTKTAYQAAIKAATMPEPAAGGEKPAGSTVTAYATPFDGERDELSPKEAAFLRALMKTTKRGEGGMAVAS